MNPSDKVTAKELFQPLPPIYPISLIEVACRALEALRSFAPALKGPTLEAGNEAGDIAVRIIRDGLSSHEAMVKEGRSRG